MPSRSHEAFLWRLRVVEGLIAVAHSVVRWGGAIVIMRYGYLSIVVLAGEHTFADIGVNVLADVRISQALAWLLAGSGVTYGLSERKLRKDTVERIQGRNQALELRLNPIRTSSQLTPRGDTREEDR